MPPSWPRSGPFAAVLEGAVAPVVVEAQRRAGVDARQHDVDEAVAVQVVGNRAPGGVRTSQARPGGHVDEARQPRLRAEEAGARSCDRGRRAGSGRAPCKARFSSQRDAADRRRLDFEVRRSCAFAAFGRVGVHVDASRAQREQTAIRRSASRRQLAVSPRRMCAAARVQQQPQVRRREVRRLGQLVTSARSLPEIESPSPQRRSRP